MDDYKEMYFTLFNATTKAINDLQRAQQEAENLYISGGLHKQTAKDDTEDSTEKKSIKRFKLTMSIFVV